MQRVERRRRLGALTVAVAGLVAGLASGTALAKKARTDPALACVATKHEKAGEYCESVLRAWAKFEKSGSQQKRNAAVARAAGALNAAWSKAEQRGSAAGVDCAGVFAASSTVGAFIDSATGALIDDVNIGLDPDAREQAKCGAKILEAAAARCEAAFAAESTYHKRRNEASAAGKRAAARARASDKFVKAFAKAKGATCPTAVTADVVGTLLDAITARVERDTLASPEAGDGQFVSILAGETSYGGRTYDPICADGTPYRFFARRGTVNKLVYYYQGGGACWEQLTCSVPTCDINVTDRDSPGNVTTGFADLTNPANPFKDWNAVFVSYCGCDIHFGDAAQDYANVNPASPKHVEHRGYHNARVVEKWAREHFLAPETVFITGSSAGAYGAWFHAPLLHRVWPTARFHVLADAGNGVVTQEFLQTYFPNWNFPSDNSELKQAIDSGAGIPRYTELVTRTFPKTNWAHYATAFDGGSGGQTGFYNLMLHGNDPLAALTWWEGSCAFRDAMRSQAVATAATVDAATGNYRYFIGSGSRHTMWGSNKVYTDMLGGVPTLAEWVSAMLASGPGSPSPGWVNVEANPYNVLLPGDTRPNPLAAPFEMSGDDVVVDCSAAP